MQDFLSFPLNQAHWHTPNLAFGLLNLVFRPEDGFGVCFCPKANLVGAKTCSHCNFQYFYSLSEENQVSLARTLLSDPGSENQMCRLGGSGWKMTLIDGDLFVTQSAWTSRGSHDAGRGPHVKFFCFGCIAKSKQLKFLTRSASCSPFCRGNICNIHI